MASPAAASESRSPAGARDCRTSSFKLAAPGGTGRWQRAAEPSRCRLGRSQSTRTVAAASVDSDGPSRLGRPRSTRTASADSDGLSTAGIRSDSQRSDESCSLSFWLLSPPLPLPLPLPLPPSLPLSFTQGGRGGGRGTPARGSAPAPPAYVSGPFAGINSWDRSDTKARALV